MRRRGVIVAPAKTGPDYIDPAFLTRAALREAVNLDPWSMSPARLKHLASVQATGAELLLVEGVMGLFDAAADGFGSTADLAELLDLPVIFVVDADRQSQSVAPLVAGFANWRVGVRVAGVILNRIASMKHERMLVEALAATGIPCLGAIPRNPALAVPERHLGLVLPGEVTAFETFLDTAAEMVGDYVDLDGLRALAAPLPEATEPAPSLPPLGQRIAIAQDAAFAFLYPHLLDGWRAMGAELSFFSPSPTRLPPLIPTQSSCPAAIPNCMAPLCPPPTYSRPALSRRGIVMR